ncbi:MAG: hypothetical protein MJ175_06810 [Clostridia bacterium]|nr:hypothetical protein [Clostridia bacterium]
MPIEKSTKKIKRRFGDRVEGRRVRTLTPINKITPYIMKTRNTRMNLFKDEINTEKIDEYIKQKKAEGRMNFNIMHIFLAAYVRAVSQMPALNRFVSGYQVYARHNIEVCMVIKKEMTLDAPDTAIKVEFERDATPDEVYDILNKTIEDYRNAPGGDFDNVAGLLNYLPRFLLRFAVGFLEFLDYFGIMPRFLTRLSPFHGSLFITSMGSLGIPPIYHHLYDFGNVPIFMAFGTKKHRYELQADGSVKRNNYVGFSIVCDEGITDGFYYAAAFKYMLRFYKNPWLLDTRPETIVEDIP